jgi:hypothetical protein
VPDGTSYRQCLRSETSSSEVVNFLASPRSLPVLRQLMGLAPRERTFYAGGPVGLGRSGGGL